MFSEFSTCKRMKRKCFCFKIVDSIGTLEFVWLFQKVFGSIVQPTKMIMTRTRYLHFTLWHSMQKCKFVLCNKNRIEQTLESKPKLCFIYTFSCQFMNQLCRTRTKMLFRQVRHQHTPTPWLAQLLVLGKSRVN